MSRNPENKTHTAVLTREGPADYATLSTDPFPTPKLDEIFAVLVHTDTGNKYQWTGEIWVQTHAQGMNMPVEISDRGTIGVSVFVQDQTTDPIDVRLSRTISETTIAVETVIDASTITLAPGHGTVIGNSLGIVNLLNSEVFFLGNALGIAGDVITVDSPVNQVYAVGSLVRVGTNDINILGSLATPVIFSVRPIPGLIGDITRVIMEIQDNVAMDFSTFGGLAALTNGCVLRVRHADGSFTN